MFGRSPRIELDILGGKRTTGVEEDDYVYETLQKMNTVFDIVDKTIKKNLDYRAKGFANTTSENFEVGKYVLVFTPARKIGEASKLVRVRSLPFRITKKIREVCFEFESLNWANSRVKIVRSITQMKPYKGPTEFRNVKHQVNPTLYMSKHHFEIIEDEEDLEILEENAPSSHEDQNSQERIRLPSGQWILRHRITGEQRETSPLDNVEPEGQEGEIENLDEVNPNEPEENAEPDSSESIIECTIHWKNPWVREQKYRNAFTVVRNITFSVSESRKEERQ